jgi:PRTRC genetic system protein E
MNFFKEIFDLGENVNLNMTIARAGDRLSITVLPASSQKLQPLVATGTPEELAEGFAYAITTPLKEVIGLMTNAEQFKKSAEEAAGTSKKEAEVKPAAAKKEKPAKTAKSKPAKEKPKKEKPAKPAKPAKATAEEPSIEEGEPTLF